eukprot:INCI14540.1.p1 GENE.INCI14540.1~~INCI14540.1.p1  ORF type:complete len:292 (+),score=23.85 INCI14540.1:160-1035(+)
MRSSTLPENKVLIESSPLQPAAAEEEEPRPRFGLSKHYDVGSFLAGAVALCSVQIISGVALSNFLLFGNSFDPYVHVFLEVLQVAAQVWIFFLHHRAKITLGAVLGLLAALIPLSFAIGIRCLILVESAMQHPSNLNGWQLSSSNSAPAGITVDPVDVQTYSIVYPLFANLHTYSQMLLIILSCFRQLAHPFLNPATPMQLGLIVVLGVFLGASVLIERHLADFDVKFAVISFVVGAVLLAWAPVVVWLDRCLIQLRHRKHDSRPQPVILFYGLALVTSAIFAAILQLVVR